MKISPRQRWASLTAILMLTIGAAAWQREGGKAADADAIEEAPVRPARTSAAAAMPQDQAVDRVRLERMRARAGSGESADAFAAHRWGRVVVKAKAPIAAPVIVTPPPPPVAAPVAPLPAPIPPAPPPPPPPPPPTAPPLPFVYMGKILSEEANAVFLTLGDRNLIVHEGDVIDSIYRVDKISIAGLTFTHIPTGIEQNLLIGGAQ